MNEPNRFEAGINRLNDKVGKASSWLILVMTLLTFMIAIFRYAFDFGWTWLQDLVTYFHGSLFMLAAGYAYLHSEHVRVDIFYSHKTPAQKAKMDLFGIFFLLFPMLGLIFAHALGFAANSWAILEGSQESGGMPGIYVFKSMILVFCVLLFLQGLAEAIKNWRIIKGGDHV